MKRIKIDSKRCFIVAEAGVNHNGDIKLAKKLIDVAVKAGADAVKFQTFKAEQLVTEGLEIAEYQKKNIGRSETQLHMLKKLELKEQDFIQLKNYCDQKEIIFLSTAHTESTVDFINKLVPAFKTASGDLTNLPLLEKIAKKKKMIILSTGMGNLKEIEGALITIRKNTYNKILLLHCTSNYPCPVEDVNLRAMITLKERFEKKFAPLEVGYSDHTEGFIVSIAAVVLGARVLEKHFTLNKNLPGPDHRASLGPDELIKTVRMIRDVETALGSGIKRLTKSEEKIKRIARKSVVANTDIMKGDIIKKEALSIKRPGTGIEPKFLNKIVGKRARRDIKQDTLVRFKDFI